MLKSIISLGFVALASVVSAEASAPGCATACWTHSQFVSSCGGDVDCLCKDNEFQQATFFCLHSQCPSAHYAPAVGHTLAQCNGAKKAPESVEKVVILEAQPTPNLIKQANLKKRVAGSGSAVYSATGSASGSSAPKPTRGSGSASAPPRTTITSAAAATATGAASSVEVSSPLALLLSSVAGLLFLL